MSVRSRDNVAIAREAVEGLPRAYRPRTSFVQRLSERVGAESLAVWSLMGLAFFIGAVVRLVALSWGDGFPLNDGGMFLAMVDDLKANSYRLPEFTSYNGGGIAFAYPSLPFYMGALTSNLFGWSSLQSLVYLPVLFSLLMLPAFYILARTMLPSRSMAAIAVMLLAVAPRAFNWEIVGGGLTRSPGFLFATLALWQGFLLFSTQQRRYVLSTGVFSALTIFCHMEMGWFVAFSMGYFVLALGGGLRRNLRVAIALAALVPVLTAPWWLETLLRVGHEPMLAATQTGAHSPVAFLRMLTLLSTEEAFFPIVMVLGLLGFASRLQARDYFLPLWIVVIFLLDPRKAATTSMLPLALLGAWGMHSVVWPAMRSWAPRSERLPSSRWAYLALGFMFLVYSPFATLGSASDVGSPLYALPREQREAMSWVRDGTPVEARFLVMPSVSGWAIDGTSEWFPALAERYSVATVQGSEWLPDHRFAALVEEQEALVECAYAYTACLDAWSGAYGVSYDYVFVPRGEPAIETSILQVGKLDCCGDLRASLAADARFERVFENAGASIYRKLP